MKFLLRDLAEEEEAGEKGGEECECCIGLDESGGNDALHKVFGMLVKNGDTGNGDGCLLDCGVVADDGEGMREERKRPVR